MIGSIWTKDPDGVDRDQTTKQGNDAEHDEEESTSFGHVDRHERVAHDVVVGTARPRELGVFLDPDHHEVHRDQRENKARYQQDMHGVHP